MSVCLQCKGRQVLTRQKQCRWMGIFVKCCSNSPQYKHIVILFWFCLHCLIIYFSIFSISWFNYAIIKSKFISVKTDQNILFSLTSLQTVVKCHWWYLVLGVTVLQTQCTRSGLESGQYWHLGQFLWCQLYRRWRHRSVVVSDDKVGIMKTLAFLWRGWRWCREIYVNFCRTTLFVCNTCF